MCPSPTFLDLSVHNADHALHDRFVDEVKAVRRLANLPVVCLKTDLLNFAGDVEQCRVSFNNLGELSPPHTCNA